MDLETFLSKLSEISRNPRWEAFLDFSSYEGLRSDKSEKSHKCNKRKNPTIKFPTIRFCYGGEERIIFDPITAVCFHDRGGMFFLKDWQKAVEAIEIEPCLADQLMEDYEAIAPTHPPYDGYFRNRLLQACGLDT